MSYSSYADLQKVVEAALLIELTDDEGIGSGNPLILTRVAQAISDADSVIDAHIRPLTTVPAIIKKISMDLALYELYCRRGARLGIPDYIMVKQKDSMNMLSSMRDGKMDIGTDASPSDNLTETVEYSDGNSLFTSSTLEEF